MKQLSLSNRPETRDTASKVSTTALYGIRSDGFHVRKSLISLGISLVDAILESAELTAATETKSGLSLRLAVTVVAFDGDIVASVTDGANFCEDVSVDFTRS